MEITTDLALSSLELPVFPGVAGNVLRRIAYTAGAYAPGIDEALSQVILLEETA